MKTLIAAIIFSQVVPGSPFESREVPMPIPADICVEVHWSKDTEPWKEGEFMRIFEPPLNIETRNLMDRVRVKGTASLKLCSPSKA